MQMGESFRRLLAGAFVLEDTTSYFVHVRIDVTVHLTFGGLSRTDRIESG